MTDPRHVFISHAVENRRFAGRLGELIAARGATVFLEADIYIGDVWADVVRREVERSSAIVLVIPPDCGSNRNNVLV